MISSLLQLIIINFKIPKTLAILCLGASFIAFLSLFFMIMVLFLDLTYRPQSKQYPFNIILDRIMPCIILIIPTFLILNLNINKETTWLQKFGYIIIIHCFIIIPLFYYWSKHRHWDMYNNNITFKTWNSPKLYLDLSVAIIYPAFWGFLFSYLRYIRLGNELDLTKYFNSSLINTIIVLVFLWPYVSFWFFTLIKLFLELKKFLWQEFSNIAISIMFILLRSKLIFKILEKFFQLSFLWITFVICNIFIYRKKSFIRKQIHRLYLNSYILWLLPLISCFFELLYTKGILYYSLYILVGFLFLRTIVQALNAFNGPTNDWVLLCCYSNYMNYNWTEAYFPTRFWLNFNDIRKDYKNYPPLSKEVENHVLNIAKTYALKDNKLRNMHFHVYMRLMNNPRTKFIHRLRLEYYHWSKIKT